MGIRVHPDPILYRPCEPVTDFGKCAYVVAELLEVMDELERNPPPGFEGHRPLGLAAPQIGRPVRVFVLALYPHAFVNPVIEYVPGKPIVETESCYSLPGVSCRVERAARIKLRCQLPDGTPRAFKMRDRDARAAQHEIDHLDGVTIVQRAEPHSAMTTPVYDDPQPIDAGGFAFGP